MEKEQTMQQMMEVQLVRMDAWGKEKEDAKTIQAKMKAHQEELQKRMNANKKSQPKKVWTQI
jgi:hypothetical protein